MRNATTLLLIILFTGSWLTAQVKIGDNPQNINPASILELESSDKVLVITRVTTTQMNAIVPSQGALCYNLDLQSIHFYDGTQWVNIGDGAAAGLLTADPIVNNESTIVITATGTGNNFEVAPNSIRSEQIVDGGVNGVDIQDGSIGPGKLQNNSVTEEKLSENSVGAFALDNDNIPVSAFNNDVGYITAGDIDSSVSADANNAISAGSDTGAFYDDTNLLNDILDNAAAIALDNDQSDTNEVQDLTLTGTLLGLTLTGGTVDLGPIVSAGGSDDQNLTTPSLSAANVLTLNIEGGSSTTIDLSPLAGAGTTVINSTATVTVSGSGTGPDPYEFTATGGGTGSTELVDGTTLIGDGTSGDRFRINPSATVGQYLRTTGAGVVWDNLPMGTGGSVASDGVTIVGDGADATTELRVPTDGITNVQIANATILGEDLSDMGASNGQILSWDEDANGVGMGEWVPIPAGGVTANEQDIALDVANNEIDLLEDDGTTVSSSVKLDGSTIEAINNGTNDVIQLANDAVTLEKIHRNGANNGDVLKWDDDGESPGVGGWVSSSATAHTGTAKSLFFADINEDPSQAFHPGNGSASLIWDYDARVVAGTAYGSLGVGMDGAAINNEVKVHIVDNVIGGLSYPLQIQNRSNSSAAAGIIFSVTGGSETQGKGVLTFERTGNRGVGDFHFLQDQNSDFTNADLNDKSFTITSDKDIQLYGNLIDRNGIGIKPAATVNEEGWVLTNTATGTEWAPSGALGTDDQNASEVNLVTPVDIDGDSTNETTVEEAIAKLAASSGGNNLSNTNLVQSTGTLVRTFDITNANQSLVFTGAGNVGIGNTANPPSNKLHVGGAIRSEGILNSNGTQGTPAYRFSGDTDTGMYWSAADELGFAAGGQEVLRLGFSVANGSEIIANGSLELTDQLIDETNSAGTDGQILTATSTGTEWKQPAVVAMGKANGANSINVNGATVAGPGGGMNTVTFTTPMSDANYIIQLTVEGDFRIYITSQTTNGFTVETFNNTTMMLDVAIWHFTILDF